MWYVHGGVYTDMSFISIVNGTYEDYGPFSSYDEAFGVWRGAMGLNIDICEHRLFIIKES